MSQIVVSKKDRSTWVLKALTPKKSLFEVKCVSTGKKARLTKKEVSQFFRLPGKGGELFENEEVPAVRDTEE